MPDLIIFYLFVIFLEAASFNEKQKESRSRQHEKREGSGKSKEWWNHNQDIYVREKICFQLKEIFDKIISLLIY